MVFINLNGLESSLTKGCAQFGWGAKYYFPCCPKDPGLIPIDNYFQKLKVGAVFAYNDDSPKLLLVEFEKNNSSIWVLCEREGLTCEREGFKPWLIAEIKFENNLFLHSNLGSYFEKDEAQYILGEDIYHG